ncbi:MAG: TerC family protein [Candidatus Cohnella colombiensis]|uniref:TerC family protein n=1 Tax=Candidatus Cohnella colombiensis TaxID=3121368 RepID=A0AA95EU10_9BACL|nr:MAG: TerC family protein [Cohnella sp.]
MDLMDQVWVFIEIMIINIVLSGDNAIVIALVGRRLPSNQRRSAVWWGALAAILLRVILTIGAVLLLHIPFLQTVGALLLFAIALQLLVDNREHSTKVQVAVTLAGAIWTIVVADFVMSLDNVLAVAAVAGGDTVILIIGIVMSIPIIIWGSSFIMRLMDRLPGMIYVGGALLAYTASEMIVMDPGIKKITSGVSQTTWDVFPYASIALLLAIALLIRRRASS